MLVFVSNNDCSWTGNSYYCSGAASGINITDSIAVSVSNNYCDNDLAMWGFPTHGITVLVSSNVDVISNHCVLNDVGIFAFGGYWGGGYAMDIVDNNCSHSSYGIYYYGGSHSTISGNDCTSGTYGINVDSSNNISVSANNCNMSYYECIYILTSQDMNISDNIAGYSSWVNGISIKNSMRCLVSNNSCDHNSFHYGIYLWESENSTISNNTCSNNDLSGIRLDHSAFNRIEYNDCSYNNGFGIELYNSDNNEISSNICTWNTYAGIAFYSDSDYNYFIYNDISHNNGVYGFGIWIGDNSRHNIITENMISDNSRYGVYIDSITATYNEIYLNAFIRNNGAGSEYNPSHVQAYDDGYENLWYKEFDNVGNHWSDWTTPDTLPPLGIVDLPYDVAGSDPYSSDMFPLTETPVPWIPEPPVLVLVGLMLTVVLLMRKGRKTRN